MRLTTTRVVFISVLLSDQITVIGSKMLLGQSQDLRLFGLKLYEYE